MPSYSYAIATLAEGTAGLTNVETLLGANYPPRGVPVYAVPTDLGSGGVRRLGVPVALWRWDFLPLAQRETLRTYCTGDSAVVYITTRDFEATETGGVWVEDFSTYKAVMIWPEEKREARGIRLDFEINFRLLEKVTV